VHHGQEDHGFAVLPWSRHPRMICHPEMNFVGPGKAIACSQKFRDAIFHALSGQHYEYMPCAVAGFAPHVFTRTQDE
jgi:hypothetical protein